MIQILVKMQKLITAQYKNYYFKLCSAKIAAINLDFSDQ